MLPRQPSVAQAQYQGCSLTSTALLLQFPASSTSPAPLGSSCHLTTRKTTATTSTASGLSSRGPRAASTWPSMTLMWSLSLTSWSSRTGPRLRPQSWAPSRETNSLLPSQAVATWPVLSSRPTTPRGRGASTSPLLVSPPCVLSWPSLWGCPVEGAPAEECWCGWTSSKSLARLQSQAWGSSMKGKAERVLFCGVTRSWAFISSGCAI